MSKSVLSMFSAASLCGLLMFFTVPGCVITIGSGTDDGTADNTSGDGHDVDLDEPSQSEQEMAEEAYSQLDPQELALASAKAGFTTSYLMGTLDSLGLDPETLDDETILHLMEEYMPIAASEADKWLAVVDPATLVQAGSSTSKYECTEQFGCAYSAKCLINPPPVNHICFVDDCGSSKCGKCPTWVADLLKSVVSKAWCSYICVESGSYPAKIVAVGAGAISPFKNTFIGPLCVPSGTSY